MAGILSIGKGYDPDYLTKSVGMGAENYYLSAVREHGEPPGHWSGPGAAALGLAPGSQVDPVVMEKLYGEFLDPRGPSFLDGSVPDSKKARLGRKAAKYTPVEQIYAAKLAAEPEATEERKVELRIQAKKEGRKALQFFDLTYSVHKSVTLVHAGLLATARQAEEAGDLVKAEAARAAATEIQGAIEQAAAAGVERGREVAGWARVGYHGKKLNGVTTGRWAPAGGWVVASFFQHTSRNGDPQLHVHQAVLNRQECADGVWRSLDGQAIYRVRAEASAVAERTMMERLTRTLGLKFAPAVDGQNFQVEGVSIEQIAAFSTRRAEVTERLNELAAAYEARHGYAPNARTLFTLAQQATKDTKTAKPKLDRVPTQAEELAAWEERTTAAEIDSLTAIPGRALFQVNDEDRAAAAAELAELDMDRVIAMAIADAQAEKSTFSEYELTRHISRHLPASFGGLEAEQVKRLILQIRDEALRPESERVLRLSVPDVVAVPPELQHADGRSVFRDPTYERWTTPQELDAEARFIRRAAAMDAPAAEAARVAERLGYPRGLAAESGVSATGSGPALDRSEVSADPSETDRATVREARGEPAAAAAESGPEHGRSEVSGAGSDPARGESDPDREEYAFGLTSDQVAAVYEIVSSGRQVDVLEGYAGTGKSYTVARTAEVWRELTGGQVVGLTTAQNAAYVLQGEGLDDAWNLARWLNEVEKGTTRLEEGQLVVVDEGSMVTNDTMTKVAQLAREAGAKVLITGDSQQLAAPGAGGLMRQLVGEQGSLQLTEVKRFLAEWEREASVRLRAGDEDVLAVYDQQGRIRGGTREEMAQGARDAYVADHVQGRQSLLLVGTNPEATELAGQVREELVRIGVVDDTTTTTLRDGNRAGVWDRITARDNDRTIKVGDTERQLTNRDVLRVQGIRYNGDVRARLLDKDGKPGEYVTIPADYAQESVELAYAGTAHSAQGRTVDTAHALVDESMARQMLYVEMSRGRHGNWAWVITEQQNVADLRPEPAPTPALDDPERGADTPEQGRATADPGVAETGSGQPVLPGLEPAAAAAESGPDAERSTPDRGADDPDQTPDTSDRDALGVLAGVLENDQSDLTATEVMRAEAERVTHLAHLGSEWTSVVKDALADDTTAILAERLDPQTLERLDSDPARGAVVTVVRQAVLAGHDPREVLTKATQGSWEKARSIGQVLTARIHGVIGTGEAVPDQTWVDRTPRLANPRLDSYVREVASQMDAKVEQLGEQAAQESPSWLTERLGEVPEEVMARTQWQQRAGLVYAYREQYGNEAATATVLGPAPDRHSPEQRAAWTAANDALGATEEERRVAEAGDGQLWVQRARYEREAAWAPPHVGGDLRDARIERDDRHRDAVRLDAQATHTADASERGWLRSKAAAARALMSEAGERIAHLEVVDRARAAWHSSTEADRQTAMQADAELHRRHRDLDLPPLHQSAPGEAPRPDPAVEEPEQDAVPKGQEALFDVRREPTERPAPEAAPEDPQRSGDPVHTGQEELDLDLTPEPPVADQSLQRALEQAAQANHIVASRAEREAEVQAQRGAEPGPEERQRQQTYQDALSHREQAELDQRTAAQRAVPTRGPVQPTRRAPERTAPERTVQPHPVERDGPELGL